MKKIPILEKLREFRCSLSRKKAAPPPRPRPVTRLNATARRATMEDYDDGEPTTKLSSAFIVVLILHIVAVGGIFAFKGIKAHRLSREMPVAIAVSHPAATGEIAGTARDTATVPEATPIQMAQRVYKAHGGETLAKVAAQQGVSVTDLAQYNGLSASAVLKPNQSVVIPPAKTGKVATQTTTPSKPTAAPTAAALTSPDAKQRAAFLAATQQKEESALAKTTPKPSSTGSAMKPFTKTYVVAKNDTVTSIARRHGISADALMKLNKIDDPKKLQLNQTLQIPAKKSE